MTHILTKEQFDLFIEVFHTRALNKTLSSQDMILSNIFRSKDIRRGFTPITNPNKLSGGADPWLGFKTPFNELRFSLRFPRGVDKLSAQVGVSLTPEMVEAISAALEES